MIEQDFPIGPDIDPLAAEANWSYNRHGMDEKPKEETVVKPATNEQIKPTEKITREVFCRGCDVY